MRFNGSAWVVVGSAGFSTGEAQYLSLSFAPDGTPYVAYQDGSNGKAIVMRFKGTAWETVGSAGFSAGGAAYTTLGFTPDGTPYVAYEDYGNSYKATVMKLASGITPTTTTLGSSLNPSTYGGSVTLTATVAPSAATDTVTFKDDTTPLTCGTGSNPTLTTGTATCVISGLAAGSHSLTAEYAGDTNYAGSTSAILTQQVNPAPVTVTLSNLGYTYDGNAKSATCTTDPTGLPITITLTYNGSPTAPTTAGSYTVVCTVTATNYSGSDTQTLTISKATPTITWPTPAAITYGTVLSATQLNASSGVAGSFVYAPLAGTVLSGGTQTLNTTFTPTDTTNYASNTASVGLMVDKITPTTTITSDNPDPSVVGEAVAVNYSVTSGGGTPTGTVTVSDGTGQCTGTVTVGTCNLTFTSAGSKTLTATYGGDSNFNGSPSTGAPHEALAPTAQGNAGGGLVTAAITGGTCVGFANGSTHFLVAPTPLPPCVTFPYGLFEFTAVCPSEGGTLTLTVTYPNPLPPGTQYWKYGSTSRNATPHWYVLPATITGNTAIFTIADGGLGDDIPGTPDGAIVDQGGPGAPGAGNGATGIPTLSEWGLLLLGLVLSGLIWHQSRRTT
jgi:hypothetical protein